MKKRFTMKPGDLPALSAFECVARNGSFTRAADELGLSPSALSQTMRKLERTVGVRLLNRTTRKVSPTEAGARFLAAIAPGLIALAEACEALEGESEQPRGTVRVSLSRVAFNLLIGPHLPSFTRAFPEVRLELGLNDGLSEIVSEGFDVGIRLGERLPKDMVAVPIGGAQRLAIVGSPSYFASRPIPRTPRDLLAHDCIRLRFVTSGRLFRYSLSTDDGGDIEIDVDGQIVLNDMVEIVGAACAGLGLAQVFEGLAAPHLAAKRLVRVLDDYSAPFAGFRVYYPTAAQMPRKTRAFIEFFQKANREPR